MIRVPEVHLQELDNKTKEYAYSEEIRSMGLLEIFENFEKGDVLFVEKFSDICRMRQYVADYYPGCFKSKKVEGGFKIWKK